MRPRYFVMAWFLLLGLTASAIPPVRIPEPKVAFAPFEYVCRRAGGDRKSVV